MNNLIKIISISFVFVFSTTLLKADGHDFTIFNNSGMLQFDGGGSDPEVLAKVAAQVKNLSVLHQKL